MTLSRRKFVGAAWTAGVTGFITKGASAAGATVSADPLVLRNEHLLVRISRETGCVQRVESGDQVWNLEGAGMRLHVPAPEHRFHYLTESHAVKPRIESDEQQAVITWAGFESQRMGKLDIEVKETVRVQDAGVHFSYEIRNGSPAVIESYTYPRLKNIKPPAGDKHLTQASWGYSGMSSTKLWPTFGNQVGY